MVLWNAVYHIDRRLKEDVAEIDTDKGLSFVQNCKPVSYKMKGQKNTQFGYIAQDLLKNGFNELINVIENEDMQIEQEDSLDIEGYQYSVDYSKICVLLHSAIKSQDKK